MTLAEVAASVADALRGPCAVASGTPIVVACSGGADSVALAHALGACRPEWPVALVAFVDHGLRDVTDERAAARAAAEALGVPFAARQVAIEPGRNLQAAARAARYEALEALTPPGAVLATGHTATDQAETVLQRLVRGAGLRGLAGVRARSGRRVRPLLAVTRAATRGLGLPFADDVTNATGRFLRNRLRDQVLPLLAAENPRVEQALAEVARAAADELALVDALIAHLARSGALSQADLRGADPRLVEAVVRWRHRHERGEAPLPRASAAALADKLVEGAASARVSLGAGLRGHARRGRLSFEKDDDPRGRLVAPGPGSYRLGRVRLTLELRPVGASEEADASGTHAGTAGAAGEATAAGDGDVALWVDASAVVWPLELRRAPRSGDFSPGAGGGGEDPARRGRSESSFRTSGENVSGSAAVGAIPGKDKMHRLVLVDGAGRVVWPVPWEQPAVETAAPRLSRGVRTLRIRLSRDP